MGLDENEERSTRGKERWKKGERERRVKKCGRRGDVGEGGKEW